MQYQKDQIITAAKLLQNGSLVSFPTETVYGIGANAYDQQACLNIFKIKSRPSTNPLIVHLYSIAQALELAEFNDTARKLSKLWPGPLTMVLPRKKTSMLAGAVTAGLDTIAIRIPSHIIALKLLKLSKCPIAAPSANKSGMLSSTKFDHVKHNFKNELFVLNDHDTVNYGIESTIVDLSTEEPAILRYGFITPQDIEAILKKDVTIPEHLLNINNISDYSIIKAPGMSYKHYSPKTKIRLNATNLNIDEVGLNFGNSRLNGPGSLNLSYTENLLEAAQNLFDYLHKLDEFASKNNLQIIAIAPIPNISIGLAINDRLHRAAIQS